MPNQEDEEPMPTIYTPYVIERSSRGERTYDVFSRLLMDRIIFLGTPITAKGLGGLLNAVRKQ